MPSIRVLDPKGVTIGTWSRENITIPAQGVIDVNKMGQASYDGKLLNLSMDVRKKLVEAKRAVNE